MSAPASWAVIISACFVGFVISACFVGFVISACFVGALAGGRSPAIRCAASSAMLLVARKSAGR